MKAKAKQPQPIQTPVKESKDKHELVITKNELAHLKKTHGSKSAVIRAIAAKGHKTADIAYTLLHYNYLSSRSAYQHVRNVLTTPLKRQTNQESNNERK